MPEHGEETSVQLSLSPKKAYFQVLLISLCVALVNTTNYAIVGLQTSLYGLLGSVSLGIAFLSWTIVSPFTSVVIAFFGLKVTMVLTVAAMSTYTFTNYHPTWYTLVPGNILFGVSSGIQLPVTSVYINVIASGLATHRGEDANAYISKLQGFPVAAVYTACVIGNIASSVILAFNVIDGQGNNGSNATLAIMVPTTNVSSSNLCEREQSVATLLPWQYPTLVSFCAVLCIASILLSFGILNVPGRGPVCRSQTSVFKQAKYSLIAVAKSFIKINYFLVFPMKVLDGMSISFFFGVFSLYFITRCLDLSIVGVSVIAWALSLSLSSTVVGKISLYTSRMVLGIAMALCQVAMFLFMFLWKREPSYAVVFVISSGLGLSVGVWSTLVSVYLGVVGKKDREPVFSLYWAFHALGDSVIFFISSSVSLEAHLAILLFFMVVGFTGYIVAEILYGELKERRLKVKEFLTRRRTSDQLFKDTESNKENCNSVNSSANFESVTNSAMLY